MFKSKVANEVVYGHRFRRAELFMKAATNMLVDPLPPSESRVGNHSIKMSSVVVYLPACLT